MVLQMALPGERVEEHDALPLAGCGEYLAVTAELNVKDAPWRGHRHGLLNESTLALVGGRLRKTRIIYMKEEN